MATGQEIIDRALLLIGAKVKGQASAADDVADALIALNTMLRRWEAKGIGMGWTELSGASLNISIPTEAEEAVAYNLAIRLAPEYGRSVSQEVATIADDGYRALLNDAIPTPRSDTGLPRSDTNYGYDIYGDWP